MAILRRLASTSALMFAARIGGAGLIFVAQAAIARFWGATALGDYLVVMAAVNLAAMAMPLGFHTVGAYFTAEYRVKGEGALLRRFLLRAYGHVALVGLLLLAFGFTVLPRLGGWTAVISANLVPVVLLMLATSTVFLNGAILVGAKRPLAGLFADGLVRPLLVLSSFALAALFAPRGGEAVSTLLWLFSLSYLVVAAFQFWLVLGVAREVPVDAPARQREARRWWRFAVPWVLISLATDFFFDLDLLMLAGQMESHQLAIFGVCARIFALISFGVTAVYAVTLPDMFEAEANADRAAFHHRVGEANLVAAGVSVVLFGGALIGGPLVLMMFGPDFAAGGLPLAILALGLVARAGFGPASLVLSIHDRPYASLPAVFFGLATLVVGNVLLVPPLGLMGAALAALISIVLWSAALWFTALRQTGVDVSILALLRGRMRGNAAPTASS